MYGGAYVLAFFVIVYYICFHYKPMLGAVIAFRDYKPRVGVPHSGSRGRALTAVSSGADGATRDGRGVRVGYLPRVGLNLSRGDEPYGARGGVSHCGSRGRALRRKSANVRAKKHKGAMNAWAIGRFCLR